MPIGRGQSDDVHHHGRGVVLATLPKGQFGQGFRRAFRRGPLQQDAGDIGLAQDRVDPVAAEEKAVVGLQGVDRVIRADFGFQAHRPVQDVVPAETAQGVVFGQEFQVLAAQPVNPGVPHVDYVGMAAPENQPAEGGTHVGQLGIAPAHGVNPAVGGIQ